MAELNPVTVAKAKPLLFSTPMVQAIMRRQKTQTRRVVDPQPNIMFKEGHGWLIDSRGFYATLGEALDDRMRVGALKARFSAGDIIYVRETSCDYGGKTIYLADYGIGTLNPLSDGIGKWRPSIFMPRQAARIWLEVTKVRCEKLQDCTEEDAKAEGAPLGTHTHVYGLRPTYLGGFATRWDVINAKLWDWNTNPWVWVYDFKVLGAPEYK